MIKIGYSIQPEVRIEELRRLYGMRLKILATMPGGRETELAIHKKFDNSRLSRIGKGCLEWFYPTKDLQQFIKNLRKPLDSVMSLS